MLRLIFRINLMDEEFYVIEFSYLLTKMLSEVAAKSQEVKSGTETTISCAITGLTGSAVATVVWQDSTGAAVTGANFAPTPGTQSSGDQTATLLVKAGEVTADKVYSCQVTSGTYTDSAASATAVNLDVYG